MRVVAALIENNNEILVAQRRGGVLDGKWEFPGGKVHPQESDHEALSREILEELSLEIQIEEFVGEFPYQTHDVSLILAVYWARTDRRDVVLTDHKEVRWLDLSQISQLDLAPADRPVLAAILP